MIIKGEEDIIKKCTEKLRSGKLAPWKVEQEIAINWSLDPPQNFRIAALARQRYIEEVSGESFNHLRVSDKPYKIRNQCQQDNSVWELDAHDEDLICPLCGSKLIHRGEYAPLVANYVGGCEDYYSFAGILQVKGDVKRKFTNLLVYGTGLGPMGVTKGCFHINKMGGAQVKISDYGKAARCLGFLFKSERNREKAIEIIKEMLTELKDEMNKMMSEFGGKVSTVEFDKSKSSRGFILYVDFTSDFINFRGHGDNSRAVGFAKKEIESQLKTNKTEYELSVIAQGYDGDLKPSPRNKRGRYASALVRIPVEKFSEVFGVEAQEFLSFVEVDRLGAQKLGCQFYSGMGGEIIPAVYRATKVNPSPQFSCVFIPEYKRSN
jgi:hypothetical protein